MHGQFSTHDEVRFVGVLGTAFVQKLRGNLCGVQKHQTLAKDMDVHDGSYKEAGRMRSERLKRHEDGDLP
jgi:hypothetical protein